MGLYKSRQVTAFVRTCVWPRASLAQSSCGKGSPCLGRGWRQPSPALPCASWVPAESLSFMPAVIDCRLSWSRALVPAVAESLPLFQPPFFYTHLLLKYILFSSSAKPSYPYFEERGGSRCVGFLVNVHRIPWEQQWHKLPGKTQDDT